MSPKTIPKGGKKMKSLAYVLICLISVCFLSVFVCSKAEASDYLGEFCWQAHLTQTEKGPQDITVLMKLGISYMGGSYLTAQGSFPIDDPVIFGATGQVVGNEILLTFNNSQQHSDSPWRDSGVGQLRINLSTLNGTFWNNYMSFNSATGAYNGEGGYSLGTLTYVSCP